MAERQAGFWSRHRGLQWALGALLFGLLALGAAISILLRNAEPLLRSAIVEELEEYFHARVEMDSFHLSLVNGLGAEGKGLRIWLPAQAKGAAALDAIPASEPTPLIQLKEFRFHAPLRLRPGEPIRISVVELKGLTIDVPPKAQLMQVAREKRVAKYRRPLLHFDVGSILCDGAHLTLETDRPGKLPLEFAIARIELTGVGGAMRFDAELTNPKPVGAIWTTGTMGPWRVDDPGQTPLAGSYRFEHADLGVFKGIAGMLSSTGRYDGALRDLVVDGETDTPDFRLTKFGAAVPLRTVFHAHVDGTNGDTWLQPVHATLGQSHFTAEGKVVRVLPGVAPNRTPTPGGHEITLDVTVDGGRMEDFLRLTSKSGQPLLTGTLHLKTTLELPPGTAAVDERLKLKGSFTLDDAQFTSAKIQSVMSALSLRSQGRPKGMGQGGDANVRSAMQSDFIMANAVIAMPDLKYTVPGTEIDLKGTYGVQGGLLDFAGTAKTQATVSQMVGGWKGALLKPFDRFFKSDGAGTAVPIRVRGTREHPNLSVDLNRLKHRFPAVPTEPQ